MSDRGTSLRSPSCLACRSAGFASRNSWAPWRRAPRRPSSGWVSVASCQQSSHEASRVLLPASSVGLPDKTGGWDACSKPQRPSASHGGLGSAGFAACHAGRLAFDVASRGHSVEACEGRGLKSPPAKHLQASIVCDGKWALVELKA